MRLTRNSRSAAAMLGLDFIRAERASVEKAIEAKGVSVDLDELLSLDGEVRRLKTEIEALRAERNAISAGFKSAARKSGQSLARRQRRAVRVQPSWKPRSAKR